MGKTGKMVSVFPMNPCERLATYTFIFTTLLKIKEETDLLY